jgi:orotidine-5'-phosphate decarboxylase
VTAPAPIRDRLALALDVGTPGPALQLAERLGPWFGIAKVGLELYAEAGPEVFERLQGLGFRVFADLKLHDIPTTVKRAARVHARRGVGFLNFHASGGEAMLRAAVEGCAEGARDAGLDPPVTLAVTVLTSDPDAHAFEQRLAWAMAAGCAGVVCAAGEIAAVKAVGSRGMAAMVAGVRLPGGDVHDQARVATPAEVMARGGDWMVIGRAVTAAPDPEAAAEAVTRSAAAGRVAGPATI